MPRVTGPEGQDIGDVTNATALNYYRREPGYTVEGDQAKSAITGEQVVELTPDVDTVDVVADGTQDAAAEPTSRGRGRRET